MPCVLSPSPGALSLGKLWVSRDLGYSFEYPTFLSVTSEDGRNVQFEVSTTSGFDVQIWVTGARAGTASVDQLVTDRRNALSQRVLGLSEDDDSADRVIAPSLGFARGSGGSFSGTLDSPTGPSSPANVAILAGGDGKTNVVFSILVAGQSLDHKTIQFVRNAAGVLIADTVRYR